MAARPAAGAVTASAQGPRARSRPTDLLVLPMVRLLMPTQLPARPSNPAATTTLARGARMPPASLLCQGCFPLPIRLSASLPAGVGAPHGRPRFRGRLLPHAPHRRQKAKGAVPLTLAITCPSPVHLAACTSATCPGQRLASSLRGRTSLVDHVPQMLHLHLPSSKDQWCWLSSLACSALAALGLRCRRVASEAGKRARAVPMARATSGARRA